MTRPVVSAVFVAVAILAFILGWYTGRPPVVGPWGSTTVVAATVDIKCGDTKYSVSTGKKGDCKTDSTPTSPATHVQCSDGKGNYAEASCGGGCEGAGGSGSCTIK